MNQFDIGESMGNMGNLQSVPEDPESTQFGHASPINYGNNDDDNQDDFENSHSTINDNPFTKKSNFLAYHTLEKDEDRPSMVNENIKYSATNKISNKVSFSPITMVYRNQTLSLNKSTSSALETIPLAQKSSGHSQLNIVTDM